MPLFLTSLVFDGLDRFLATHGVSGPVWLISNASRELPDQRAILAMALEALRNCGRDARTIDVLTDGTGFLERAGAIVMTGGDPFRLRSDLHSSGASHRLEEAYRRGVPIIGQSAGAIVCGPRLEPIRLTSPFTAPDDADLSGLNLTDLLILPHHGRPGRTALHRQAAMAHAGGLSLTPLWDDEVLVCSVSGWTIERGEWRTRPARAGDAQAIGDVFQAAALQAWSAFLGRERLVANRREESIWRERIAQSRGGFLVTEDSAGSIVAFACWRVLDDRTGEVDLLYTHPRAWGAGLGRRLLERTTWNLLSAGCRAAVLWTEARNERALAVYRANGWVPDGAVDERDYFGAPIRNLRHRLDLTEHAGGP